MSVTFAGHHNRRLHSIHHSRPSFRCKFTRKKPTPMPRGIFLLDTNILSDAQKPLPNPILADWFRIQKKFAIPFPVILEIERGIAELAGYNSRKAMKLREWMDNLLATDYIFPDDSPAVARVLGSMYCCGPLKELWFVDGQSKKKPGQDLFIAAIAITHGFPIATLNVRDFERINRYFSLPGVYDPGAGVWAVPVAEANQQIPATTLSTRQPPFKETLSVVQRGLSADARRQRHRVDILTP